MKRILFVDDEVNILHGLRRLLRSQRRVWDMSFVGSGEEALAMMATKPFDVLVTDMQMPGMNGAELLEHVQARHPRTVRIVLSGHSDMEACMHSVSGSHQFLSKPCDADALRAVVERACNLDRLLQAPRLREKLGAVVELPVVPRTYDALSRALAESEVDLQVVAGIVEQDIGIASKILQLVNSSYFGLRHEVVDLRQATAYLGVTTIKNLVLAFGMFRQIETRTLPARFSIDREQSHALLTARIASKLLNDKAASQQVFLAALLHDVGKLVLATHLVDDYESVAAAQDVSGRPSYRIETELLGISHAYIGAYLLGLWGMPYSIVEAVAHHHAPRRVLHQTEFGLLAATHVADALASEQNGDLVRCGELDEAYLDDLGVLNRLPAWRKLAAEAAESSNDAA